MTVYYIRADNGAIKIGYTSKDINTRMQSLSTSSPLKLELIAYESGGLKKKNNFIWNILNLILGGSGLCHLKN